MSSLKKCALAVALNSFALVSAFAQTPTPPASVSPSPAPVAADQASPAAAAPTPPTWSVGPLDVSGTVDGYFTFNSNHPDAPDNTNGLYNFNDKADSFDLSLAKFTLNHDPDPVGVHIDFGFGQTMNDLHAADSTGVKYLEQAFVSLKPAKAKGLEVDFGQFVTSAGAEVIEAKDNWNYSRSLLFVNAIPYYHFGARATMPFTKSFTGGVQLVNGWNNDEDNNSGKTVGLTGAYVKTKYSWFANYYVGPENASTNKGFRNLIDTTILTTLPGKFNFYLNYDYGQNRNAEPVDEGEDLSASAYRPAIFRQGIFRLPKVTHFKPADDSIPFVTTDLTRWQGIAGDIHFQATPKIAFSPRGEFFTTNEGPSEVSVGEITLTGEYKLITGALMRVEYRGDFADQPVFFKGTLGSSKQQNTLTFALVAFFGPKR